MKSLCDREIAETRAMIAECDRLMIETRKDLRAAAALQKSNARAIRKPLALAIPRLRLNPYPQRGCVVHSHKIGLKYPNIPHFFWGIL
jgi:hypothetical protein